MNGSLRVGVLRVLLAIVVALSLAGFAVGGYFVLTDLAARDEMFDGLAAAIGAGVMFVSVLVGVLATVAAVMAERRPMVSRALGVLLAMLAAAIVYPLAVDSSWGMWLVPFPVVLLVAAVLPDGGTARFDA